MTVRDEKLAPWPRTPADTKQQLADYYACITGLDFHVGRIFDRRGQTLFSVFWTWREPRPVAFGCHSGRTRRPVLSLGRVRHSGVMSRPLRIEFRDAIYHVMARGDARQAIFHEDEDYEHLRDGLARTGQRCDGTLLAFA